MTSGAGRPTVAVVGGGPAGLMAAEAAAEAGAAVTVYERMPSVGRKLLMAGRGGLNLTHTEPLARFRERYGPAAPRLDGALAVFGPEALRDWAAGLGQETIVGSSGRVFPRAWKASPLLRAWLARLDALGVAIRLRHRWTGFDEAGALLFETPEGPLRVAPGATVLAMGGASWPRLGADGAWAPALEAAGVSVRALRPANAGLIVAWSEPFRARFEGEPLKRIALSFAGRRVRGEAVVTATGLEGGATYALSGAVRDALDAGPVAVAVDLRPDLAEADLARALGAPQAKRSLSTTLRKAAGLPPVAVGLLREAFGADLPREPAALAAAIKAAPLPVAGVAGLERAISSAGGIRFEALSPAGELLARPGVFVAGEMADWEAPTGGYLLQASMATGHVAGRAAAAYAGSGAFPRPSC